MKTKYALIVLIALMSVGCRGVNRLLGQGPDAPAPYTNINPDDYYITGTTAKDHDSVHFTDPGHVVKSVEILKADGTWYTLERPEASDYYDSYQVFSIPSMGVYFGNLAYTNATGGHTFTSDPSAPKGTQYRIRIVKAA